MNNEEITNEIENEEQNSCKYNVVISNFEGPLDLLCFLISKNKKDIFDISLSELTDKYIEYLDSMSQMNMEIATEFLVMASTLLYIKSKKLLPILEDEQDIVEEMTAEELLEKIAIYKMYKEKQEVLRKMYADNFGSYEKLPEKLKFDKEFYIPKNVSINELYQVYSTIQYRNQEKINKKAEEIERIAIYERVTIKSKVKLILEQFKKRLNLYLISILVLALIKKIDVVTAFLGVLELSRLKHVRLNQNELYGDIEVEKISNQDFDISLLKKNKKVKV